MMPASFSGPTSSLHGVKSQMRMWARKTREMSKTDRIQVLVSVSCEAQRSLDPKRVLVPSEGGYQPPCHDIHCRRMRLSLDLNEVSCFFLNIYLFRLCWVFIAPCAASGGYSLVAVRGLLIEVASLVAEHRL